VPAKTRDASSAPGSSAKETHGGIKHTASAAHAKSARVRVRVERRTALLQDVVRVGEVEAGGRGRDRVRMKADLRVKCRAEPIPSRPPVASVPFSALVFALVLACVASGVVACAGPKAVLEPSPLSVRPEHALDVVLELDAAADLDLHVTDPELETVYFGNTPSVNGGVLDRDVRCESEGEISVRRETVRFEAPLEGHYRVGVDHVKACRRFRKRASYTIRVTAPGLALEKSGEVGPGRFEHKALEFDWPAMEEAMQEAKEGAEQGEDPAGEAGLRSPSPPEG